MHKLSDTNQLNNSVITFGNFDGIHRGHKYIINKMLYLSNKYKIPSVLITFKPHTNNVIYPNKNHKRILTYYQKYKKIIDSGIDYICEVNFDKKTSRLKPDEFLDIIIKKYNPSYIVFGYDNKFGINQSGSYDYLINKNKYKNKHIYCCDKYSYRGQCIKSSIIKKLIINGNIKKCNKYLGYNYILDGIVVEGNQIGRTIGFPTANINMISKEQLIPLSGVYSVNLLYDKKIYNAICNIGKRPTIVNSDQLIIEVHLIDTKNINLYGEIVFIEFKDKIRNEIQFNNIEDLKKQIKLDISMIN